MQAGRVHPQHRSTSVFSFASQEDVLVNPLLCSCFYSHLVCLNYVRHVFLLYVFAIEEKNK